jgi:hypothetical protein
MSLSWPSKDPGEVLDYQIDWSALLDGDTIDASSFAVLSGSVVVDSDSIDNVTTTVWLSGGTLNETCTIENTIETAVGRTFQQSVRLRIRER